MDKLARAIIGDYQASDYEAKVDAVRTALASVLDPLTKRIEALENAKQS